jgi:hypothetical protein
MTAPATGARYVRYEATVPNARGAHVGVFGLANGLARSGRLNATDQAWWRAANDWFDAAYPDPGRVDPALFDRARHPVTACWFRTTASHLLARLPEYLDLLDRYGIAWAQRYDSDPGRVLYADDVQVVVVPRRTPSARS